MHGILICGEQEIRFEKWEVENISKVGGGC